MINQPNLSGKPGQAPPNNQDPATTDHPPNHHQTTKRSTRTDARAGGARVRRLLVGGHVDARSVDAQ